MERGYPVSEVSERLGQSSFAVRQERQLAKIVSGDASKDAKIRQLKRVLARVTEERDIQKTVAGLARLCAVKTGRVMLLTRRAAAVRLLVA
ncbi:hypothetical protein [Sphingobium sp. YR657]|uniref:hypothetical protein n=1 Tax=Sphingobium sp. YR657 TaxID=1884366 RepID=UPI0009351D2C|nr:hypothetical protein [Sphingobium sp. YR657]